MTDAKAARREYIEAVVAGRLRHRTYWLTRNRDRGVLSSEVDVWLSEPLAVRFEDRDVHWIGLTDVLAGTEDTGGTSTHYGRWTVEQARQEVGNGVPATERECVCVGPKPETQKERA